jgi:hypothetical protein
MTALTIELKLSSRRMIAAACRATSVPLIPIAKPTSALRSAGASFVPSPVTATTCPSSLSPVTRQYLSVGRDRANTSNLGINCLNMSNLAMMSTRGYCFFSAAFLASRSQSQMAIMQALHTTPPTLSTKSTPSITSE